MLNSIAILIVLTVATGFGDYFIKLAANSPQGILTRTFAVGMMLYALPAIGWFFLMQTHSLTLISVAYSASTIIILSAIGFFIFNETIGPREILGLTLALASVAVMAKG